MGNMAIGSNMGIGRVLGIFLACALCLSACQSKDAENKETAQKVSLDNYAPNLELASLMQLVLPDWKADGPQSVKAIDESEGGLYRLSPVLLVKLSAERVLLLASGVPATEQGGDDTGHASEGLLGAYWFEQRDGKWWAAGQQPRVIETGFFGNIGKVKAVPRGGNQWAVAIENGSCWQGMCGHWLHLFAIGDKELTPMLEDENSIFLASSSTGATEACSEALKAKPGTEVRIEGYSENYGCHDVRSKWRIVPATDGAGELVIDFSGLITSAKVIKSEQAPSEPDPAAEATTASKNGDAPDESEPTWLVKINPVKQSLVYHLENGVYRVYKGTNPAQVGI